MPKNKISLGIATSAKNGVLQYVSFGYEPQYVFERTKDNDFTLEYYSGGMASYDEKGNLLYSIPEKSVLDSKRYTTKEIVSFINDLIKDKDAIVHYLRSIELGDDRSIARGNILYTGRGSIKDFCPQLSEEFENSITLESAIEGFKTNKSVDTSTQNPTFEKQGKER